MIFLYSRYNKRFFAQNSVVYKEEESAPMLTLTHSLLKCLVLSDYEVLSSLEFVYRWIYIANTFYFTEVVGLVINQRTVHLPIFSHRLH